MVALARIHKLLSFRYTSPFSISTPNFVLIIIMFFAQPTSLRTHVEYCNFLSIRCMYTDAFPTLFSMTYLLHDCFKSFRKKGEQKHWNGIVHKINLTQQSYIMFCCAIIISWKNIDLYDCKTVHIAVKLCTCHYIHHWSPTNLSCPLRKSHKK